MEKLGRFQVPGFSSEGDSESMAFAYFRPNRLIIPSELFTERVRAAGNSLEAVADAMAEDMVERAARRGLLAVFAKRMERIR